MSFARIQQKWRDGERGAALVEFAIAIPIFIALIALIFDTGIGFAASRNSSATVRSAARVGALAGERSDSDRQILEAVRATYGGSDVVRTVAVYRSEFGGTGKPPVNCWYDTTPAPVSTNNECNVYPGTVLDNINGQDWGRVNDASGDPLTCDSSVDAAWCPLDRRPADPTDIVYLGVAIWVDHDPTVALSTDNFELQERAVFAMYFPPDAPPTPGP